MVVGFIIFAYSFSSAVACSKRLLAYYPYWNSNYRADKIQYTKLTHICHAFAAPQADGSLYADPGPPALLEPALITNAHAAGVKVLISIGGASTAGQPPDSTFRTIAGSAALRTAFANSIEAFCRTNGYDGVDMDWEMPGAMDPGSPGATDRSNFNLMIQAIRTKFNSSAAPAPTWLISIAVSSGNWGAQWLDYPTLNNYVDFYNDMTYDMHGSWNLTMGYNAPLYQGNYAEDNLSDASSMDYILTARAVPPDKVNMGMPFYGQYYPGPNSLFYTCGNCSTTQANYNAIAPLIGNGWTYHWDAASQVPYLTNDGGTGIYSYDDAQSIGAKADYALNSINAGGVFMWDLSEDYITGSEPLLDAMYSKVSVFCSAGSPTFTPTYTRTLTATPTLTATRTNSATATRTSNVTPTITPTTGQCWTLVWSDEFNGPSIDTTNWNFETGCTGWGNSEYENYTNNAANSYTQGGDLVIKAVDLGTGGGNCGYTSARMTTRGKRHFTYGKIEARIKCPYGQGIWPAFWMLGSDIDTISWPACGEIDILEMIGGGSGRDNVCFGTAHWDNGGNQSAGGQHSIVWPAKLSDDYHIYDIEWDAVSIKFFMDGVNYSTVNTTAAGMEEFQGKYFFILLNVAVGGPGSWPGAPDGTTVFPQMMNVDYVRWYQMQACVVSPTITPTINGTASRTPTPSFSRTMTPSITGTMTRTCTGTPSFTPTYSFTRTATGTITFTNTATRSATAGSTQTFTITPTNIVSPTATQTWTGTPLILTNTATASRTPSFTPTYSSTRTYTPTFSYTATRSAIPSATASFTASVSPSNTYTYTVTGTITALPTPSVTITPSATGTLLPSITPTLTAVAQEKLKVIDVLVYPNPVLAGTDSLNFVITSTAAPDSARIKIYTRAFRLIRDITFTSGLSYESKVRLPLSITSGLASGVYYYDVILHNPQGEQAKSKAGTFIVLR
jgi:GH18 family chitinase